MSNQENEISLSQLLTVFKKSIIRGIIYILVCVILTTTVLILLKTFTSTNVYNSNVSFSKTDDTTLESMKLYKANVVNKALQTDGKGLDISDKVVKNLTVSAVIPEDKEKDSSFTPTSFTISLKSNSELKLSSGEYKSLVDNIAKEYVNQFATSSMPELYDSIIDVNSQLTNEIEYLQITYYLSDIIDDYIINLESFASSNSAVAAFADTDGKTLNGIISDLKLLKSFIDNLKYTIALNKSGFGKLKAYIDIAKASIDAKVAEYAAIYESAKTALETYTSTVKEITQNANGNNVYIFDDAVFVALTEQAAIASKQHAEAVKKQNEIVSLQTAINNEAGTPDENVANSLRSSATSLATALSSYKTLAKEFNNNKTTISPATISKPAYSVSESFISMKIIVIANVAVVLIAYLVAFSQTFTVMKKKGELK